MERVHPFAQKSKAHELTPGHELPAEVVAKANRLVTEAVSSSLPLLRGGGFADEEIALVVFEGGPVHCGERDSIASFLEALDCANGGEHVCSFDSRIGIPVVVVLQWGVILSSWTFDTCVRGVA